MSIRAMVWAFDQECPSPAAKLVLIKLADHADDDGKCWPSQAGIAHDCGLTRQTVNEQIGKLVALGIVTREQRFKDNGQQTNLYFLQCRQNRHPLSAEPTPPVASADTEPSIEPPLEEREAKASPKKLASRWVGEVLEEWIADAEAIRLEAGLPAVDARLEAAKFADFWRAKAGQAGAKLDWRATWRNWIRNARPPPSAGQVNGRGNGPMNAYLQAGAEIVADAERAARGGADHDAGHTVAVPLLGRIGRH